MNDLIPANHPGITHTFQGVQQDCHGRMFRQGLVAGNKDIVMIDADDGRRSKLNGGNFSDSSLRVITVDRNGVAVVTKLGDD